MYRDRIKRKKYDRAYRLKTNRFRRNFYQLVGSSCFFCGSVKQLSCHKKDFQKHVDIASLTLRQIELESPEDYARVCYCCHYGVHWVHNILGLTWLEILIRFKINKPA